MSNKIDIKKEYECSIENYISDEYSICREERQYALFLYNILKKHRKADGDKIKEIFTACCLPLKAEIENVFYEATFMRDLFERNRRLILSDNPDVNLLSKDFKPDKTGRFNQENSFNYKLLKYLKIDIDVLSDEYKEHNLGGKGIECDETAKQMMRATPDIAVIYSLEGERYLHFLECKFESYEGSYKSKENKDDNDKTITQCQIQWKIADFLCKEYKLSDLKVSDQMEKDERSCLVQFVRKLPKSDSNEINIKDLIDLNEEIFSIN